MKKVKVLIVDDSALVRQTLYDILSSDPRIEVTGTASDPFIAAEKINEQVPDVITLDVEMPRMDGLTFLKKIMAQHPIPVVICSSLAGKKTETAFKALEYGAVEVIHKPRTRHQADASGIEHAHLRCRGGCIADQDREEDLRLGRDIPGSAQTQRRRDYCQGQTRYHAADYRKGGSGGGCTGGTEALKVFLEALPRDCPGIVIVQHMPEGFTSAFSKRLDSLCQVTVKEADNDDYRAAEAVPSSPPATTTSCSNAAGPVFCRDQGRSARLPPPPFSRCALPLHGTLCRKERHRRHHDRHGR